MDKQKIWAWVEKIGNALVVIVIIVGLVLIVTNVDNLASIFDSTDAEATVDCEQLQAELFLDFQCQSDPGCTMTRTELGAYNERAELYGKYCEDQ